MMDIGTRWCRLSEQITPLAIDHPLRILHRELTLGEHDHSAIAVLELLEAEAKHHALPVPTTTQTLAERLLATLGKAA